MDYYEFSRLFKTLRIFSIKDIYLINHEFDDRNLTIWSKKGYITKIRNGWYTFTDLKLTGLDYYLMANRIYSHSYISLELAFSHYGIIPEGVLIFTSVSTNKTQIFRTPFGEFSYKTLKPTLNWGYKLIEYESQHIKIAEIEKAILDFLYLNPSKDDESHFEGMRFNTDIIDKVINIEKFMQYQTAFENSSLTKRSNKFLEYIKHA